MLEYELHRQRAAQLESAARDHRRTRQVRELLRRARQQAGGAVAGWVTAA
ncbi:hypothetical protein [Streptomyces sp. NBRC 109706]|nr:hypothetical protein [Streptomyces sp. NBRC 109706]